MKGRREEKPRGGWVSASSAKRTKGGGLVSTRSLSNPFNRTRLSSRRSSIVLFFARLTRRKEGRFIDIRNFRWLKKKKKKSAGILGPVLRFSSLERALVQSLEPNNIYVSRGSILETNIKVVENLIGWSKERERNTERESETSQL